MLLLRIELYAMLYLLAGCATVMAYRKYFEEVEYSDEIHKVFTYFMGILAWPMLIGGDVVWYVRYRFRWLQEKWSKHKH